MNHSPYLDRIERYAGHAVNDAKSAAAAVNAIPSRPDFETNAEDTLRKAEAELAASLKTVRTALKNYKAKPVTA